MQEKLAARKAISLAREARRSDRVAMQAVENERLLAETASMALAKEADEKAEAEARQAELASQASSLLAYEAVRKAERDRRYAARKARANSISAPIPPSQAPAAALAKKWNGYRLPEVLRDHPQLAVIGRISISDSIRCVRLVLWDERLQKLISFHEAHAAAKA